MTLTTNGKNYIAEKFGIGGCFVRSGINYTVLVIDGVQYPYNTGTGSLVSKLISSVTTSITIGSNIYTNEMLKIANDNTYVNLIDTQWIVANDGLPIGESQYCVTSCTTPTCVFTVT